MLAITTTILTASAGAVHYIL
jgi:hypothetical protein